jgi:LL-diaminopimelate aminotransferase
MAGLRLAFVAGRPDLLEPIFRLRTTCSYGSPTAVQYAGAFALDHAAELTPPIAALYRERRDAVIDGFRALGWDAPPPPATMFVWLPVPRGFDAQGWTVHLVESAGLVVTPGNAFGPDGEGYFRISLVADADVLAHAIAGLGALGIRWQE